MKRLGNEEGYALLVVVLLVVLVMGFFTVFITGSLSHAKQEQIVDKKHLATIAAEMGVDYFSNKILNQYKNEVVESKCGDATDVKNCIENEINKIIASIDPNELIEGASREFNFKLREEVNTVKHDEFITIKGNVLGAYDDETKELSFQMTFPFPEVVSVGENGDGGKSDSSLIDIISKPSMNEPTEECKGLTNNVDLKRTQCKYSTLDVNELKLHEAYLKIDHNVDVQNSLQLKKLSQLYVGGSIVHALNPQIDNSTVYVGKDFYAKNHLQVKDNSFLYVEGKLESTDKTDLNNSKMFVGGGFKIQNDLKLNNNSTLVTIGDLKTVNNPSINHSFMFVNGNMDAKNDLKVTQGDLYVTGDLKGLNKADINNRSKVFLGGSIDIINEFIVNNRSEVYITGDLSSNKIDIKSNSNVCITGKINYKNEFKIGNNSTVYVLQNHNYHFSGQGNITVVKNLLEMREKCDVVIQPPGPSDGTGKQEIDWINSPKPSVDVWY